MIGAITDSTPATIVTSRHVGRLVALQAGSRFLEQICVVTAQRFYEGGLRHGRLGRRDSRRDSLPRIGRTSRLRPTLLGSVPPRLRRSSLDAPLTADRPAFGPAKDAPNRPQRWLLVEAPVPVVAGLSGVAMVAIGVVLLLARRGAVPDDPLVLPAAWLVGSSTLLLLLYLTGWHKKRGERIVRYIGAKRPPSKRR